MNRSLTAGRAHEVFAVSAEDDVQVFHEFFDALSNGETVNDMEYLDTLLIERALYGRTLSD